MPSRARAFDRVIDSLVAIEEEVGAPLSGSAEERKTSLELLRRMPG